jgi:uncharacterized protein (UPF0297 family)
MFVLIYYYSDIWLLFDFYRQGNGVIGLNHETMMFKVDKENDNQAREILLAVYEALKEKGYNPISQIVGYILSGDPTYITNHKNARSVIRKIERDELLEELVKSYLEEK